MPSLCDPVFYGSVWEFLVQVGIWSTVALGIVVVVFYSFFTQELKFRFILKNKDKLARMSLLRWELQNKAVYNPAVASGDEMEAKVALTDPELRKRHEELVALSQESLGTRMRTYFLTCPLCQCFWVSLALMLMTEDSLPRVAVLWNYILSAFGYAVVIYTLGTALHLLGSPRPNAPKTGGCGGGKH